jgi:hypothetical protein
MAEDRNHIALTVTTSDAAVAYCLGALHLWSLHPEAAPAERRMEFLEWGPEERKLKLMFPSEESEQRFVAKADQLLSAGSWSWSRCDE